jgi:hypothetical protein
VPLFAAVDLGRQLLNAVQWLMVDNNSVHVQGEGLMEVIAWETEPGFAVHILNYNGPNAFRGRMRRPVTLSNPIGSRPASARGKNQDGIASARGDRCSVQANRPHRRTHCTGRSKSMRL